MALNKPQKDFIENSISHLFDLSSEEKQLATDTKKLQLVFSQQYKEKEEDYLQLQKCIAFPEEMFGHLEKLTATSELITIGMVQSHILFYTTQKLKAAADLAKIEFSKLEWVEETILLLLSSKSKFNRKFIYNQIFIQQDDPLEYKPADKIFSAQIHTDAAITKVFLRIKINFQSNTEEIETLHSNIPDMRYVPVDDGTFFDLFMKNQTIGAWKKAGELVPRYIFKQFIQLNILKSSDIERASIYAKELICYTTYYNLIKDKVILFQDICNINYHQKSNLTSPTVMALVQTGRMSIQVAKNLTPLALRLLSDPYYYALYQHKYLNLKDLENLTDQQVKNLILPAIISLLKTKRLVLNDALSMSSHCANLFSNITYFELFVKGKISLHIIRNLNFTQSNMLLSDNIFKLIIKDYLTVQDALQLTVRHIFMLTNNSLFKYLLEEGVLYAKDLKHIRRDSDFDLTHQTEFKKLSVQELEKLKKHMPEFIQLACENMLYDYDLIIMYMIFTGNNNAFFVAEEKEVTTPSILSNKDMLHVCTQNLIYRLNAIISQRMSDDVTADSDSIEKIALCCRRYRLDFVGLRDKVLDHYIKFGLKSENYRSIQSFALHCSSLNISPLEVWGRLIATRIYHFFQDNPFNINGTTDNVNFILNDMTRIAISNLISPINLYYEAIKIFLHLVKKEIEADFDLEATEIPTVYKKIHAEIQNTETKTAGQVELEQLAVWKETFLAVLKIANQSSKDLSRTTFSEKEEVRGNKRAKISSTLFVNKNSKDSNAGIYQFCQRVELMNFLNRFDARVNFRARA